MSRWLVTVLLVAVAAVASRSTPAQTLQPGVFPDKWFDGSDCAVESRLQIHHYNADTVILRQSLCTSFEGPFLYLLFGAEDALLLDTGAGGIDVASAVDRLVRDREAQVGRPLRRLIVAHSHAHPDHVGGDTPLRTLPYATVVGQSPKEVADFFGFTDWREGTGNLDLGGRILDIVPIPGHEPSHIAIYDRLTALLLTGDTLYPGRLYFSRDDFPIYQRSVGRLVDFTKTSPVSWLLGAHIEMTSTPKVDFPFRSRKHQNEHRLELPVSALIELKHALDEMDGTPRMERRDHFIIFPLN
jgi:glyoxylase-like metal-dependent hydrolase (beta-lactamase superfamily II)